MLILDWTFLCVHGGGGVGCRRGGWGGGGGCRQYDFSIYLTWKLIFFLFFYLKHATSFKKIIMSLLAT